MRNEANSRMGRWMVMAEQARSYDDELSKGQVESEADFSGADSNGG